MITEKKASDKIKERISATAATAPAFELKELVDLYEKLIALGL